MECPNCGGDVVETEDTCLTCKTPLSSSSPGSEMTTQFPGSETGTELTSLPTLVTGAQAVALPRANSGPLVVSQQFSARYLIVRLLGIGGMGAVYQAWDAELSVMVALKVVRPEVTRDPAAAREIERRFKQELLLARQVTHRNVVRIHDMGEIDRIKYITMPYIEGEDLGSALKQAGGLPIATVMTIARQVAAGLQAAHDAGIVHRDLKPANIMLEKNAEAIIMDFGIARSAAPPTGAAAGSSAGAGSLPSIDDDMTRAAATMAGSVVGTVEYMAPEQARGQDVDQRVDIYAFGLILYDLLVGRRRAAHAGSAIADLQQRLEHAPTPPRTFRPEIPEPLNQFISRCVEPDAAKRFGTTADMVSALARLDDAGKLKPVKRVIGMPVAVAAGVLLLGLSVGTWWYQRQLIPPPTHDPVSVIIADFQNTTGDPAFDRTLEPTLQRALQGATFITAYDRSRIRGLGVPDAASVERLDETTAGQLAAKAGVGVVVSGSISRAGTGYRLAVKATQTVTGAVIAASEGRAANKDDVVDVATGLIARVRSALGDEASESSQQFAMASLSATSLDVVRLYAAAQEAQSANRFEQAREYAGKAVALDPNFGIGYVVLAVASNNLGRQEDNRKYVDLALSHLDDMTERERFMTRGYANWVSGDYEECVKQYGALVAKYPADVAGRNQLGLCLSHLRRMRPAMEAVQGVVRLLPSHPLFRVNLALYASYASDFETAEQEARAVATPDAYSTLALAFAQLGQGQLAETKDTYNRLSQIDALGASFAASGLGDVAAFEGRFAEAVEILRRGAASDLAAMNPDSAAAKLVAVAHAELSRGRPRAAIQAADEALTHSTSVKIRFLAARTFVEAGDIDRAQPLVASLSLEFNAEPRAHARIIEGVIALKRGDPRQAVSLLREANDQFETWIGTFDLGRASLAVGALAQADSAFDLCLNARRGEALSLFVDEEPTWAYLPQVYYYQGRVREGLKSAGAAESFQQYLALRGTSSQDPLLKDVRARASR